MCRIRVNIRVGTLRAFIRDYNPPNWHTVLCKNIALPKKNLKKTNHLLHLSGGKTLSFKIKKTFF